MEANSTAMPSSSVHLMQTAMEKSAAASHVIPI